MDTVLFADDEPIIRKLFCEMLRMDGYNVIEAVDGIEALSMARARRRPIELLITDIEMPGMDGFSLRRAVADCHPETQVLFISGNFANEVIAEPFLAKPFTPAKLISRVQGMLAARPTAAVAAAARPTSPGREHA